MAANAGEVTVLARTRAAFDGLTYDWTASDAAVSNLFSTGANGDVVRFTPDSSNVGVYSLEVVISGNGFEGRTRARLVIVDSPVSADLSDLDYDGYPGSIDALPRDATQMLTNPIMPLNSSVFYSDQSITLGEFSAQRALSTGYASAGATLSEAQFIAAARSEYPDVTPQTDPSISNSIGVMDFELRDLDSTEADVRLNLLGNIPLGAGLKIYHPTEASWSRFVEGSADSLASAPAVDGECPASGSNNYTAGLIAGAACVRFTLTDGGPNDADGRRDGVISMIGAIGTLADDQTGSEGPDEVDLSPQKGGGVFGWALLLLVLLRLQRVVALPLSNYRSC